MPNPTTQVDAQITNGDDSFLTPAALRQPADGLGPRAHRTISRIIEATREVFLTRGYSGTTIDEIARVAEVSRASFYTYFPSKREVLLAVGAHSATESTAIIETLEERGTTLEGMADFVADYFDFLDVHGSFSLAWTQAAQQDEDIRVAGMKRHLAICSVFGKVLAASAGRAATEPKILGIAAASLLERSWNYAQLYADTIDRDAMIRQATQALWAIARGLPDAG